jgi:hypothetical protein
MKLGRGAEYIFTQESILLCSPFGVAQKNMFKKVTQSVLWPLISGHGKKTSKFDRQLTAGGLDL